MEGFRHIGTTGESCQSGQIHPLFGGPYHCVRTTINHHETPHRPKDRLRIQGTARLGGKPQPAGAFPQRGIGG